MTPALKKAVRNLLPQTAFQTLRGAYRRLRSEWHLIVASLKDWSILRANSGLLAHNSRGTLQAKLIKNYHRIEKGLALREPRLGFGADAITSLQQDLRSYMRRFGTDHATDSACNTLQAYVEFHERHQFKMPQLHASLAELHTLAAANTSHKHGGTKTVTRDEICAAACLDLTDFFKSRHSVRDFTGDPVSPESIADAVVMAQKTPSVCNRQSGLVFAVFDKTRQAQLLAFQNGNRGFGDQAGAVLVVGFRVDCFLNVGERHQGWIDGGMFAMSLVYALHSMGLGTCCLNWSVERPTDAAFKAACGLDDSIEIVMLIAVGHLRDEFRVAQSPARPMDEVMHTLQ